RTRLRPRWKRSRAPNRRFEVVGTVQLLAMSRADGLRRPGRPLAMSRAGGLQRLGSGRLQTDGQSAAPRGCTAGFFVPFFSEKERIRMYFERARTDSRDPDAMLEELNPRQREAVTTTDGPLLVLAGAGSGKTRVLAYRIAYLIAKNIAPPWAILAITFTNKAAREMQERVAKLVGPAAADIWVSTFHSMCVRILRKDIERIGYGSSFGILDATDQLSVVRNVMKELNLDPKRFEPKAILAAISAAKNELITAEQYADRQGDFFQSIVAKVYLQYQKRLK